MERENIEAYAEVQSAVSSQAGQENMAAVTTTPRLPDFVDGKDNLDRYLLHIEQYAFIAGWQQNMWVVLLSLLLISKPLNVYSRISSEDKLEFSVVKI